MRCDCKDWRENIDKLNAGQVFMSIHGQGGYKGKIMRYCPWCGRKLVEDEKGGAK